MKPIKQLIEAKIKNERIYRKNKKREFAFLEHISAYMISLTYLNKFDELLLEKSILWRKFISAENVEDRRKYYKRLLFYRSEQYNIILMALKTIEDEENTQEGSFGNIYQKYTWGALSYEVMEGK